MQALFKPRRFREGLGRFQKFQMVPGSSNRGAFQMFQSNASGRSALAEAREVKKC